MQLIHDKLLAFQQKYYLNQILRGSVVLLLLATSLLLLFVLAEGLFWMSTGVRTSLFFLLLGSSLFVLGRYVVYPATKYFRLGKRLTYEQSARIIGRHFTEINDKLLNLLQLADYPDRDNELLLAAIEKKTEELRPIPFTRAVNFQPNWKLARALAVPAMVLILILIINPKIITEGTQRFFNYTRHYNPPPPFGIRVKNHPGELIDGQDAKLEIELNGNRLPNELYIYVKRSKDVNFTSYPLIKRNQRLYGYEFRNVHEDFEYYIGNDLHGSEVFRTRVLLRPALRNFYVEITPPGYTGMKTEVLPANVGDFNVLQGSQVRWVFQFSGSIRRALWMSETDSAQISSTDDGKYLLTRGIFKPLRYRIGLLSEDGIRNNDTVSYKITTSSDKSPVIQLISPRGEATLPQNGIVDVQAEITDDFGITKGELHYRFLKSNSPDKVSDKYKVLNIKGLLPSSVQNYQSPVDFMELGAESGDEIEFFLKIWDNDMVTGPKASTSVVSKLVYKSVKDLYDEQNQEADKLQKDMAEMARKANELNRSFDKIKQKMVDKPRLGYEDKQEIRQMIEQHNQLMNELEQQQEQMKDQIEQSKENSLFTQETLEKMEQLEKLMEQMTDPDLKKLVDELQKKLDEMNNQQLQQKMDEYKKSAEELEQDMERTLELFKQLEVQQKVEELINKLENLEQRQDVLEQKMQDAKKEDMQQLSEKQQELNKEMQDIQKDLQELKEKKADTQTPDKEQMDNLEKKGQETQQEMNDAKQQMQQNNKKQASDSQKDAQQKMQQMQQELNDMQQESDMQQKAEDYENLRDLLENLLKLSFEQEELRDKMKQINRNDPSLVKLSQQQRKISDDMVMLEDSLRALADRVFEIQKFVTDELTTIDSEMRKANGFLAERQTPMAVASQHRIMSSLNTLANMLTESLDQMQQQMKQQMKQGKQNPMCKNPQNSGGSGMKKLSEMQKQLNQKMQEMMKKGMGDPKTLGEMARQQEQIRQQLKEMFQKIQQEGKQGLGNLDKVQEEMKETEDELKNKQLSYETLLRQQRILNRMLDYDKSMREREYEDQRKGRTAEERKVNSPAQLTQEELQQRIRKELYFKNKYEYSRTYKQLIEEYFNILEQ